MYQPLLLHSNSNLSERDAAALQCSNNSEVQKTVVKTEDGGDNGEPED